LAFTGYELFLLTSVLILSVALMGMNVLVGHRGIRSLGHGAIFALGAYGCTLLVTRLGVPTVLAPLGAGVFCLAFGLLFARAVLALVGMPLALATLGLAIVMPQVLRSDALAPWTGGMQGVIFTRPAPAPWLHLGDDAWMYAITLAHFAVAFIIVRRLVNGQTGRAWHELRDHPLAASALGVDVPRFRRLAFALSCLLTGMAGGLNALLVQFVAPDSFPFFLSLALFIGIVVGGPGTAIGPVLGAAFLVLVPNLAEEVSQSLTGALYGAVVIGLMALERRGLAGLLERLMSIAKRPFRDRRATHAHPSTLTGDKT
jgi:branched-chain amino acid transport system permease protein